MAKKSLKDLKNFVEGWKNVFISDEQIEELAAKRIAICNQCPHKKKIVCGLCDCPIDAKVRAPEAECPDKRWFAILETGASN